MQQKSVFSRFLLNWRENNAIYESELSVNEKRENANVIRETSVSIMLLRALHKMRDINFYM